MKKLFVSVPMKGRTEEAIKKSVMRMHCIAEAYEGEDLELIDSWVDEEPPKEGNQSIWYLGKSIEKLALADVFIGIDAGLEWPGCQVESLVAEHYGIKGYVIPQNIILGTEA